MYHTLCYLTTTSPQQEQFRLFQSVLKPIYIYRDYINKMIKILSFKIEEHGKLSFKRWQKLA